MSTGSSITTPFRPKIAIWKKDRHPSRDMLESDGHGYRCVWLDDALTIHSDGNVSCGLDDPHASRSFGNAFVDDLETIFSNPEIAELRRKLEAGYRCSTCSLYRRLEDGEQPALRGKRPSTLVIESTVKCNLRCPNGACEANNDSAVATRERDSLDFANFKRIVDQVIDDIREVYFFNYGDPFINRQADDMLVYLRTTCPSVRIISSTNGIPLAKRDRANRVAESDIDQLTFTISGSSQDAYARYHVNGRLAQALEGLKNFCEARDKRPKRRSQVTWRYLLFNWNDSDIEIDNAIALAREYGVDQFSLYLTHIPVGATSYRLAPGTPSFRKYRPYIDAAHGYNGHLPDHTGLYPLEIIPGYGPARWTGWTARIVVRRDGAWIRLSLAAMRPVHLDQSCFVEVLGRVFKVPLHRLMWRHLSILIADQHPEREVEIGIVAAECWFPKDETGSEDLRCLGVLVSETPMGCHEIRDAQSWADLVSLPEPDVKEKAFVSTVLGEQSAVPRRETSGRIVIAAE